MLKRGEVRLYMGLFWGLFLGLAARAVAVQTRTVTSALRGAQRWLCQQAAVPCVAQHRGAAVAGLLACLKLF